jgi:hypothetical protein
MPESDDEAKAHRAQSILIQALQDAKIRKRKDVDPFPPLPGRTKVYWQEAGDDVELIIISRRGRDSHLRTSLLLKDIASDIARLFPDDTEAVKALVITLEFMQEEVSEVLPQLRQDLLVRAANVRAKQVTLSADDRRTITMVQENVIEPLNVAFEARLKERRLKLRAEQKTGPGRPKGSTKPPEKRAQEAVEFEQKVERTVRLIHAATGKVPTKTSVAEAMGMGGVNPRKGSDTRLNSFSNKLRKLEIDFAAIVQRLDLHE